jgi:Zn-dependent peptidase ImmA (M78 family)/DNA-binding XRE family transcriptional regulator
LAKETKNDRMIRNMIVLAREAKGLTQIELAEKIGMSNTNVSKMEKGEINVSEETISAIAAATNFPVSFFKQETEIYPEYLAYRRRDNVAQKLITPINAKVNILKFNVQCLIKELKIENPAIPQYEVSEADSPATIAQKVRKAWKINAPVIEHFIPLLEQKGIAIISFDFETERVDSRCIKTENNYPVIIFNRSLLGDRQRFSLAYQLGHIIMHTFYDVDWERDITHEANLFASEFLMPEKDIRKDFESGISFVQLAQLKKKWKVSMISILYRADDLGYLTANQKKYLLQQFNEQKMRRREPKELDVAVEKPTLVRKWIYEIKAKKKLDVKEMALMLNLNIDEFIEFYS